MIIHIEIALNMRSINVLDLKIVAIDNLGGKSEGMKWPFSKIINVFITRKLNFWKNNCQKDIEKLKVFINETFNQYFTNIITHINISEIQLQNMFNHNHQLDLNKVLYQKVRYKQLVMKRKEFKNKF